MMLYDGITSVSMYASTFGASETSSVVDNISRFILFMVQAYFSSLHFENCKICCSLNHITIFFPG